MSLQEAEGTEPWQPCVRCPHNIYELTLLNPGAYAAWIQCESECQQWYHYECEGLCEETVKQYGPLDPYICRACMGADVHRPVTSFSDEKKCDQFVSSPDSESVEPPRADGLWSSVLAHLTPVEEQNAIEPVRRGVDSASPMKIETASAWFPSKKRRKIKVPRSRLKECKQEFSAPAQDESLDSWNSNSGDAFVGRGSTIIFPGDTALVAERVGYKAVLSTGMQGYRSS